MKKLTIEIPEWRDGRHIYVFFGREQYIIVDRDDNIHIKTERCNRCGLCCQDPGRMFPEYKPDPDGPTYCAHCEEDDYGWHCLNPSVPFGCIRETERTLPHKHCVMRYRVEKQ